ncbi:leucine-rich repeat protein, partial [Parabacteroides sp.]
IEGAAFQGCTQLLDITYKGKTEPSIADGAFSFDDNSTPIVPNRKIYLPKGDSSKEWHPELWGVASMSDLIFSSWEYDSAAKTLTLDKIVINNVTADGKKLTIGDNSTLDLSELSLPDSAKDESGKAYAISAIANNAFMQCAALAKIEIPATVKTIGNNAFIACKSLPDITYKGTTEPTIGNGAFYSDGSVATVPNRKIHLPNGEGDPSTDWHYNKWGVASVSDLLFAGWEYDLTAKTLTKGEIVLNNVTADNDKLTIGDNKDLSQAKLSLPNEAKDKSGKTYTITAIASSAFENTALTDIKLPSTLKKIGSYAFQNIKQLTSIEIPASVEDLGWTTFSQSGLTSVTFIEGSNLKVIGKEVFYECPLESITIPKSVTEIKVYAFNGCSTLTDITYLGTNEPTIGTKAFSLNNNEAIVPGRKLTIPNGEGDPNTDWHPEKWGVASVNDLIFAGWEYNSTAKTLTLDKIVINNVTADGKKLTIGENSALDLSEL